MMSVCLWDTTDLREMDPMTPADPIGPAIDGTFRRTYESSPLLHCVPTKEGLNQSCVCETS